MNASETTFIRYDGIDIACRTWGTEGPMLVVVSNLFSNVDLIDQTPGIGPMFRELSTFTRGVLYDAPGTGASGRSPDDVAGDQDWYVDCLGAVVSALCDEPVTPLVWDVAGPIGLEYAAREPQRVRSLVLCAPLFRAAPPENRDTFARSFADMWATEARVRFVVPTAANDGDLVRRWMLWDRQVASRTEIHRLISMALTWDAQDALGRIDQPSLVIQPARREGDGRRLAMRLSNATFVEIPSQDHVPVTPDDLELWMTPIRRFLLGATSAPATLSREMRAVLFTDIVGSTAANVVRGDASWRQALDRHDAIVDEELDRFGGTLIKSTGDGALATFNRPGAAVRCARVLSERLADVGLVIRAGAHVGEVEVRGDDLAGLTVVIAERAMGAAGDGEVVVTSTLVDVVEGSGLTFEDRGEHELKGIDRPRRLYAAI